MAYRKCKDHKGNEFSSVGEMLEYWDVGYSTYIKRKQRGWALAELLEGRSPKPKISKNLREVYVDKNGCVHDHLDNKFAKLADMLEIYKVNERTFTDRVSKGWSLEKALTKNGVTGEGVVGTAIKVFDDYYPNLSTLARKLEISRTVMSRCGNDVEAFLLSLGVIEYKGAIFKYIAELAREYGISENTLRARMRLGWDIERALNTPIKHTGNGKLCKDHRGTEFESQSQMLTYYGISYGVYNYRESLGWTLEEILMTPVQSNRRCRSMLTNKTLVTVQ